LNGTSPKADKPIHKQADFVNKILLFEEIEGGYYLLTILGSEEEAEIIEASRVVAANGNNVSNKKYGILYDDSDNPFI